MRAQGWRSKKGAPRFGRAACRGFTLSLGGLLSSVVYFGTTTTKSGSTNGCARRTGVCVCAIPLRPKAQVTSPRQRTPGAPTSSGRQGPRGSCKVESKAPPTAHRCTPRRLAHPLHESKLGAGCCGMSAQAPEKLWGSPPPRRPQPRRPPLWTPAARWAAASVRRPALGIRTLRTPDLLKSRMRAHACTHAHTQTPTHARMHAHTRARRRWGHLCLHHGERAALRVQGRRGVAQDVLSRARGMREVRACVC